MEKILTAECEFEGRNLAQGLPGRPLAVSHCCQNSGQGIGIGNPRAYPTAQFCHEIRKPLVSPFGPPVLDVDVLTLHVAEVAQPITKAPISFGSSDGEEFPT
jgi:hypothetical protein